MYQFQSLCFSLSTAPQVCTRVFAAVSAWAHSHGIRLLRYLDDWLILASSEWEARQSVQLLLSICRALGIVINEKKSDLMPSQTAKYLGMTIDTETGKVFPSLAQVEKFLTVAESFCAMDASPAQLWQVILCHLASLELLVPHGRLRMRNLQWHLKAHWSPKSDPPSLPVSMPREVRQDLSWCLVRDHLLTGVRFGTPAPDLHLYSDVSSSGWGSHLLDQHVSGGVVRPGEVHQSSRNEGSFLRPSGIPRRCHRSSRDSDVRQLDGCGVCQQARGHGFPGSMLVDQLSSEMDGEFQRPS